MAQTQSAVTDTQSERTEKELPPESLAELKMWLVELKRCDILTDTKFERLSRECHELKRRYHDNVSMNNRKAAASSLHNAVCERTTNRKAHNLARRVIQDVMTDADKESGHMDSTPVFGHLAGDGKLFVSFGIPYAHLWDLDDSTPSTLGVCEWVEGEWFGEWGDEIEELLTAEPDRRQDPPRIGTLYYDVEGERVDVEIWPKAKAL